MIKSALKNRRVRSALLQGGFLAIVAVALIGMILTARANLAAQGMSTGFAFLHRSTGWNIGFSLIPFGSSDTYLRALWVGFLNTVFLSVISIPLAAVIGLIVAVMRTSGQTVLQAIGAIYVEIFRNIPLLLQLMFWYAVLKVLPAPKQAISLGDLIFLSGRGVAVPWVSAPVWATITAIVLVLVAAFLMIVLGMNPRFRRLPDGTTRILRVVLLAGAIAGVIAILVLTKDADAPIFTLPELAGLRFQGGLTISPELVACVVAISIYGGAFIAEIMRAGLKSVPAGQIEASYALGLKPWQVFSRVRFPLAIRAVMPILSNQIIWLTKASTLGIAIGFADFYMVVSNSINQSGQTLELIGILMAGFLIINYALAFVLNRINIAIRLKGTQLRG